MAKDNIALVVLFTLGLVLSIQSVVGSYDAFSPGPVMDSISSTATRAGQGAKDAASSFSNSATFAAHGAKEYASSFSSSPKNDGESTKDSSSSFPDWAKDKLRSIGLMSPKNSESIAAAPRPSYGRSFGPGPIAHIHGIIR